MALAAIAGSASITNLAATNYSETQNNELESNFEKSADDILISPNGDDDEGDGSYDNPYYSPQAAFDKLTNVSNPTDHRIICRGGTYDLTSRQRIESLHGTRSDPIIMRPYSDEHPVFNFSNGCEIERGLYFYDCDWWEVQDLEIKEVPHTYEHAGQGILIRQSENFLLEGIEVHQATHNGIVIESKSHNSTVKRCSSHHNHDGGQGHADGIVIRETENVTIEFSTFYWNFDDGIDMNSNETWNTTIRYCTFHNNGKDSDTGDWQDGYTAGIKLGGRGAESGDHLVHHCALWDNENGVSYNRAEYGSKIYNCVAYNCESSNFDFFEYTGAEHKLRNCISHNGDLYFDNVDTDYNTWDLDIKEPKFRSTDPDDATFLHLQEDSPCIDSGTDIGFEYNGEAPDLGAFEYNTEWSRTGMNCFRDK